MKYIKLFEEYIDLHSFSGTAISNFQKIAKKVAYKLGIKNPKFIGHGSYGVYVSLDDNRGLKITTDYKEIVFAFLIKGKDYKYIAHCYDYFEIVMKDSPYSKKIYGIVTEKISHLLKNEIESYDFVYDIIFNENILDLDFERLEKEYVKHFNTNRMLYNIYELYIALINIRSECETIFDSNIELDLEDSSNIGRYGRSFKLIDYGHTTLINIPVDVPVWTIKNIST